MINIIVSLIYVTNFFLFFYLMMMCNKISVNTCKDCNHEISKGDIICQKCGNTKILYSDSKDVNKYKKYLEKIFISKIAIILVFLMDSGVYAFLDLILEIILLYVLYNLKNILPKDLIRRFFTVFLLVRLFSYFIILLSTI